MTSPRATGKKKQRNSRPEGKIVDAILMRLGTEPDLIIMRRSVGRALTPAGNEIYFGKRGEPDLQGWISPQGFGFMLEVKAPRGRLSDDQKAFHEAVRMVGVRVYTVRSVDEAVAALDDARASIADLPIHDV